MGSEARRSDEGPDRGLEKEKNTSIIVKGRRGRIENREGLLGGGNSQPGRHTSIGKGRQEDLQEMLLTAWVWRRKPGHKCIYSIKVQVREVAGDMFIIGIYG